MNVSVAMATYNGEKYLREQLDSIISQLSNNDEIIISDDGSTDETLNILLEYKSRYSFIKIYKGPERGVFSNFNNALLHCNNEIIFLSDQDDIWLEGKVKDICSIFEDNDVSLVLHNGYHFYDIGENKMNRMIKQYKKGWLNNWAFSSYWGCCMAFRLSFINKYIPLKTNGCAHDQLIGMIGEKYTNPIFVDKFLIKHRVHEKNLTRERNFANKIFFRIYLMKDFIITILNEKNRV